MCSKNEFHKLILNYKNHIKLKITENSIKNGVYIKLSLQRIRINCNED